MQINNELPLVALSGPVRKAVGGATSFLLQVMLGSMLAITMSSIHAVAGLVVLAQLPIDIAITIVALGVNGMLLCLLALGSMRQTEGN
jgi:hypothetical protein